MKSVFASVVGVSPKSLLPAVIVRVSPISLSILLFLFVITAVPVLTPVLCVAFVASELSGRCSASVTVSDRRVTSQAPSSGGMSVPGLIYGPLQAGGPQGIEEKTLVGAPQGTF